MARAHGGLNRAQQRHTRVCVHFLQGRCTWGNQCKFVHGETARRIENGFIDAEDHHTKDGECNEIVRTQFKASGKTAISNLDCLCDDNIVEAFSFLDALHLGIVECLCQRLYKLVSKANDRLWQAYYNLHFQMPSKRWRQILSYGNLSPCERLPENGWKNAVKDRCAENNMWRQKAFYDHAVHGDGRQMLFVGKGREFSTVSSAIRVASAFDTIVVGEGDYTGETIRINCSLEIVGEDRIHSRIGGQANENKHTNNSHSRSFVSSPVSVVSASALEVDLMPLSIQNFARETAQNTFPAILGQVVIMPGIKVRFSKVSFGGNDCLITFMKSAAGRPNSSKTFCQFDESSFVNGMFIFDLKPPYVQVQLTRCILVNCDSVRTQEAGTHAVIQPFGLGSPDDEVGNTSLADFRDCYAFDD